MGIKKRNVFKSLWILVLLFFTGCDEHPKIQSSPVLYEIGFPESRKVIFIREVKIDSVVYLITDEGGITIKGEYKNE